MRKRIIATALAVSALLTGCTAPKYYDFQMLKYYEVSSNSVSSTDVRYYMEGNLYSVSDDNLTHIVEYKTYQISPDAYTKLPTAYDTTIIVYDDDSLRFRCNYLDGEEEYIGYRSRIIEKEN